MHTRIELRYFFKPLNHFCGGKLAFRSRVQRQGGSNSIIRSILEIIRSLRDLLPFFTRFLAHAMIYPTVLAVWTRLLVGFY